MVSSELVVLLIVCVGINTGSAQEYCQFEDRTCRYIQDFDLNTENCINTTLQCGNSMCSAVVNFVRRPCIFNTYNGVNVTARCCLCNNTPEIWWDCGDIAAPSRLPSSTTATALSHSTMTADITNSATPTTAMTANPFDLTVVIVPVVVVLVVCLLVVCAIATIIILYQRAKRHHDPSYQKTIHQVDNTIYGTDEVTYDDPNTQTQPNTYYEIPDTHSTQPPPPIYSAVAEEETPTYYSNEVNNPAYYSTVTEGGAPAEYSTIADKEAPGNEGLVYSAVVVKDGKKTTVKTTVQNGVLDDSQQQPAPDTSNEELVYSAVVVKDGKKTTVKTTAQTSSTSDTAQPVDVIEGMVYSAVIRQDGKKTSVKVTVE